MQRTQGVSLRLHTILSNGENDMAATLDDVLAVLQTLSAKVEYIDSVLTNANGIKIKTVQIQNTSYPISNPDLVVPDGMSVVIEADLSNSGFIIVKSKRNPQETRRLVAGASASLRVKNLDDIEILGDTIGDFVNFLTEEKF